MNIKSIYLVLESITSHTGEWMKSSQIAEETKLAIATIARVGKELSNAGLVDRLDTGRGYRYKIIT